MKPLRSRDILEDEARGWPLAPVLALLVAAWALLALPWLSGRYAIPWDAKAHFLPQAQFLAASLARGESPFWAPFVFAGHPQAADPQSLIFSPPFLLLALLEPAPGNWAADTTVLAAMLAGMIAVVLLFRDRGWHWAGGLIAALAFGFGASMIWRIQHTGQVLSMVHFALTLLFLSRALERPSWRYGIAAGVAAAFMVLGRDQVALLAVYLLTTFVVWHWLTGASATAGASVWRRFRQSLLPLLCGALVGAAIVALPVLMTALVAEESNRPAIDFVGAGRGSLHPALLVTALAPDVFGSSGPMADYWGPPSYTWRGTDLFIAQNMGQLYIGAVPVLLLLAGLFSGLVWRREVRFFTLALAAMLVYALGWYTPVFRLLHAHLPGVDFFRRPADATFLIGYFAALLAGYVAHRLFADPLWQPRRPAVALAGAAVLGGFAFAAGLALHFGKLAAAAPPLLIAAAIVTGGSIAIILARRIEPLRPVAAALVLVAYTIGDLAYSNGPGGATTLPRAHYEMLEPDTRNPTIATLKRLVAGGQSETHRDRVELIGLGFHTPNASLTHGLENTLGYNPVRLDVYSRATGAGDTAGLPGDRKFTPLFPSYRSPLADLLGLRYIASGVAIEEIDKRLAPGDLRLIARTADAFIYENPRALPRVAYATRAETADFERIIATGAGFDRDFASVVLLEAVAADATGARRPGSVRIVSYSNTEVVVVADGADGGFAVLNDVWHPWWTATVDGAPAELLRANVLFRAVAVPPGRHVVRFRFRPIDGALRDVLARRPAGD